MEGVIVRRKRKNKTKAAKKPQELLVNNNGGFKPGPWPNGRLPKIYNHPYPGHMPDDWKPDEELQRAEKAVREEARANRENRTESQERLVNDNGGFKPGPWPNGRLPKIYNHPDPGHMPDDWKPEDE